MTKWYKTMFEAKLAEFWLRLSDLRKEETAKHVGFLKETLPKKGLTLDHCCGPGRLCIALAQDRPVVGFDLSRELLREAKKRGKTAKAMNLSLVRADMRHLPLKPKVFSGVINMWTSFGFFSEPENQRVLKEMASVMKAKGVFVLEIANPEALIRVYQEKDWSETEQFFMLEQRNWDWETKRMKCRWVYIDKANGKTYETNFDHRLYSYTELQHMFETYGLKTTNLYGSFSKEKVDATRSTRMLLVAEKQTAA